MVGNFTIDFEFVKMLEKLRNLDSLIPGVERVKIYNGDLLASIDTFKFENIGVRLKLLIVDVNLYSPTKIALENLYGLLVPCCVLALRGYGVKPWEGKVWLWMNSYARKRLKKLTASNFRCIHQFT